MNMRQHKMMLVLLLLTVCTQLFAQSGGNLYSFKFNGGTLQQALTTIQSSTPYKFVFSYEDTGGYTVSGEVKDMSLDDVMQYVLRDKPLTYTKDGNVVTVKKARTTTITQSKSQPAGNHAEGTVYFAEDKTPVVGAQVHLVGTKSGTVTDAGGHYSLPLPKTGTYKIRISYLGMKAVEVAAHPGVKVYLESDSKVLDDVVVTGYGTYSRGQYVGAISQVKGKDVLVAGENSIDQMLQGVIPGMTVINTSGKVGATPKIRIRGTSTILGNQEPLWVVDDVIQQNPTPIPNDASPLSSDFDQMLETAGNAISWLNPADIETITVLKDASATAIYGSKAANGVIVITTKKARPGQPISVTYSGSVTVTQKPGYGMYDMMDSREFMQFQQETWQDRNGYTRDILNIGYAGLLKRYLSKQITRAEYETEFRQMENQNTDWFDILFRTPVSSNHNVSISSSSEKLSSRASVGYSSTQGEAKGNDMASYTFNSNNTYRFNDKLYIDFSANMSHRKTTNFAFGVTPYEYAMNTARIIPCYNDDGTLFYTQHWGQQSYALMNKNFYNYNILNEIANTGTKNWGTSMQAAVSLHWNIVDHLQFQGDLNGGYANSKVKTWATEFSNYITNIRGYEIGEVSPNSDAELSSPLPYGGVLNQQDQNTVNWSARAALVYTNLFAKKHSVTFNVGVQAISNKVDGNTNLRYGYLKYRGETFTTPPDHESLKSATGYRTSTNISDLMRAGSTVVNTRNNTVSEYATAVYSYDNRYVVNMNARLDASNRFGQDENHKFNPTFAIGGKWRIGEEHFMEWARSWYDLFDISVDYGWQGNAVTEVSPYLIAKDNGLGIYNHQYTLGIVSLPYPDLGWEKTNTFNLGVDFSFFDGRLSAGFNYYDKRSDVLSSRSVAAEYGVSTAYIKGTRMRNHGYEFIISATPLRLKDWTWSVSFNTSKDYNDVKNNQIVNSPTDYLNGTAIVEGESYGTLYAFQFAGLSPKDGTPQFDLGEHATTPTDFKEYLVKAGKTIPDIQGGLSTSLRYKNLHLRAQFAMSFGAKAFLPAYYATSGLSRPDDNVPQYMGRRWRKAGDEAYTDIPSIPAGNPNDLYVVMHYGINNTQYSPTMYEMYNHSTARIAKMDFIRCRSLSLQYDLPKTWIMPLGIRNAYASLSLTNPFFIAFDDKWEGRDPETASWPARRSLSFSLNVTF